MLGLIVDEATRPDGKITTAPRDDIRVADLMTGPQPIVPSHISMASARKIAQLKMVETLIVEDRGCLVGFLDGKGLREGRDDQTVAECAISLRHVLDPSVNIEQAYAHLIQCGAGLLPVAVGSFLVGTISRTAVERSLAAGLGVEAPERMAAA